MKRKSFISKLLFGLITLLIFGSMRPVEIEADSDVIKILNQTSNKLKSLNKINYTLIRELNYSSENYKYISTWNSYLEFEDNKYTGFKFQIQDEKSLEIFNGTEKFNLNKSSKEMELDIIPNEKLFDNQSSLYNSLSTIRNIIQTLIIDSSITKTLDDTIYTNKPCFLIRFSPVKKRIKNLGNELEAVKFNIIYEMLVDKTSYLPIAIVQKNDTNSDFIKTDFTNINLQPKKPNELSWYYSTYSKDYKLATKNIDIEHLKLNSKAPDWILPSYNKSLNISLNSFRGKVLLIDFWIKNCGPCIKSVPELNSLKEKYKNSDFELIGVNCYDTKEGIDFFYGKYKPDYQILMGGKNVAKTYGITGYPSLVLISKTGEVLFSGTGLEKFELEKLIEKALK